MLSAADMMLKSAMLTVDGKHVVTLDNGYEDGSFCSSSLFFTILTPFLFSADEHFSFAWTCKQEYGSEPLM